MYNHGGDVYSHKIEMDFSININPFGMPKGVKRAIAEHISDYEIYPDYDCRALREEIAKKYNILKDDIICSNGAAELIYNAIRCLKPKRGVILEPAFSEYRKALIESGSAAEPLMLHNKIEPPDDGIIMEKLETELNMGCDVLFMCNPVNPSGITLKQELICKIIDKCAAYSTFVILDECFAELAGVSSMAGCLNRYKNLFIINAFTKTYAMAGIRLGYGMSGNTEFMERLKGIGQCWNVSAVAQVAGMAALDETEYVNKAVEYIKTELAYLKTELIKIGFNVSESAANFILLEWKCIENVDWYNELLKEKILIRKCSDYYGLDESFYRVAVKQHDENVKLVNSMRKIKNG